MLWAEERSMFEIKFCENVQYLIKYPKSYDESKKYPVIFFLHGSGSRGTNPYAMQKNDFFVVTEYLEKFDFVTVAPMCHEDTWFDVWQSLSSLAASLRDMPFCDEKRIYCMGTSMGAYAAWQLGMSLPHLFAAMVPICGGGMYWNAERLRNVPVWAFHGAEDTVVYPEESEKMVEAVNACGGNARLTVYDGVAHPVWLNVYSDPEVYEWLLGHKKEYIS
jgi:predicted peptidase